MVVLLTAIVLLGMGLLIFWIEPLAVLSALERLTPNITYRVRTHRPLVALSFDDGPHPTFTLQVLDILEQHNAKATFFLIGEQALRYPEVVSRIKAAGHEVGNHYFRNGSTLRHSDAEFLSYLEQTERAIGIARGPKLFRPARWRRMAQATPACASARVSVCPWLRVPSRPHPASGVVHQVVDWKESPPRSHRHPSRRYLRRDPERSGSAAYSCRGGREETPLRYNRCSNGWTGGTCECKLTTHQLGRVVPSTQSYKSESDSYKSGNVWRGLPGGLLAGRMPN